MAAACVLAWARDVAADSPVASFTLPSWDGDSVFSLEEEEPAVLVLDFFAYWCLPCLPASRELESQIRRYYESQGGNTHGLPVRVYSINVEVKHRDKTEAFMEKAGVHEVLNDPGGRVLERLGGKGLPFIVILAPGTAKGSWAQVYQSAGYEGREVLMDVIDSITAPAPQAGVASPPVPGETVLPLQEQAMDKAEESSLAPAAVDTSAGGAPASAAGTKDSGTDAVVRPASQPAPPPGLPETAEPFPDELAENPSPSLFALADFEPSEAASATEPGVRSREVEPVSRPPVVPRPVPAPDSGLVSSFRPGVVHSISAEMLHASDVLLFTGRVLRRQVAGNSQWSLEGGYSGADIDYKPFAEADVIGRPRKLNERLASLQVSRRISSSNLLEYNWSAGGYRGFADLNSVWLDEYYRQQFSGIEGYVEADPWGYNLSGGASWDTQSAAGILSANLIFQQDDVAPGYDRPLFEPLERGRERLYSGSLVLEQDVVLSPKIRLRNQLQFTRTTDRELRSRYAANVNLALSETWVLRGEGAVTYEGVEAEEEDDFFSRSLGIVLEHDWEQRWFLGLEGRYYRDNGQIETSILVSSGPPPLETSHFGLVFKHQGENSTVRIALASYETRFDEIDSPIRPFGNLYQDRSWLVASGAFSWVF